MTIKLTLLEISKFFFFLMLLYFCWFKFVFFEIPNIMLITGAGMIGPLLLDYYFQNKRMVLPFSSEYVFWLLFFVYTFLSGLVIAADKAEFASSVLSGFEYLLVGYSVFLIAAKDKKLDFFITAMLIISILAAVTTVLFPVETPEDPGRYTMGPTNNANALGISMMIGIFCALYKIDFQKNSKTVFLFALIGLMAYVIILTGSRKSLLAFALLFVFWFVFSLGKSLKRVSTKKKVFAVALIGILLIVSAIVLVPLFMESALLSRLTSFLQFGTQDNRVLMYQKAILLFKQHPLFGIGYDQFKILSGFGTYSHSTIAEVLSCTGIIGTTLYFIPYILLFFKLINKIKQLHQVREAQFGYLWMAMLLIFVFLGTVVIHIYRVESNIIFGMMIAFATFELQNGSQNKKETNNGMDLNG